MTYSSLLFSILLTLLALQAHCSVLTPSYRVDLPYDADLTYWTAEEGVGHFSEWSKSTKRNFIDDVRDGKASEWTIVMGNEGGGGY